MSFLSDLFGGKSAKRAAAESMRASEVAAGGLRDAQSYLMERDIMPRQISEQALSGLSQYFQSSPPAMTQEQLIAEAKSSPLYSAILSSRGAGEEAILRGASATGGLRSGNTNAALSDYNMNLENTALLEAYNQANEEKKFKLSGLAGLSQLPSYAGDIAGLTANIAGTQAQGITAAAQARQQGSQNVMNNLLGLGKLGVQAYGFSDLRLKMNVTFKGYKKGFAWYEWEWIKEAVKLGLAGKSQGVLAHQVYEKDPEAIGMVAGFLTVDYQKLGLEAA